jgi:excisionase family DNA binding protein
MKKDSDQLTIAEFAKSLKISEWTARKWLREGKIRGSKIGGGKEWRIPKDEVVYIRKPKTIDAFSTEVFRDIIQKAYLQIIKISNNDQHDDAHDLFRLVELSTDMLYWLWKDVEELMKRHKIKLPRSVRVAKMFCLEEVRHYEEALGILTDNLVDYEMKRGGFKDRNDYIKYIHQLRLEYEKHGESNASITDPKHKKAKA